MCVRVRTQEERHSCEPIQSTTEFQSHQMTQNHAIGRRSRNNSCDLETPGWFFSRLSFNVSTRYARRSAIEVDSKRYNSTEFCTVLATSTRVLH
jgi:hypothetical protein